MDRIDAADLCNQAVDTTCDPGTGVIVKVWAESTNRDGKTAFAEAAAGGADMELPVLFSDIALEGSATSEMTGWAERRPGVARL